MPRDASPAVEEIIEITDAFCDAHLDGEYADLCWAPVVTLARKRPSPPLRGNRRIWAAAVVHTVGWVNFLADPTQNPHLRTEHVAELLGVKQTTMANKGALIRGLLRIGRFDTRFARREMIEKNPFTWLVEIDGLPVDARWLPEPIQQELVRAGIIPHLSAQGDP